MKTYTSQAMSYDQKTSSGNVMQPQCCDVALMAVAAGVVVVLVYDVGAAVNWGGYVNLLVEANAVVHKN